MSTEPQAPFFVLEGGDLAIYDSIRQAENHLEPVDVGEGTFEGYDARGRRLSIATGGRGTIIELAESEATDAASFEAQLRSHLVRLGEGKAQEAGCDLPCLVEVAGRHAELDRATLREAAGRIGNRYRAEFAKRGGDLRVGAGTASHLRMRMKMIELYAEVEWEASRIHEHAHVLVAHRPWFSRRWKRVRSLGEAIDELQAKLTGWLGEDSMNRLEGSG